MNPKTPAHLTVCLSALLIAGAAFAAAPQFTVEAAHYAFNAHGQNWQCDGQSELNGLNCKSPYVPSYTFMHQMWVTQDPVTGQYVGIGDGGARDGGFQPKVGDVSSTWLMNGPQGGTHTLRRTSINDDSVLGCSQLFIEGDCHWELDSTLWGDPATTLDALYTFYGVYDTGDFNASQEHWFVLGESFDGVDNFNWSTIFRVTRPGGSGTGAAHLFNRFSFIQDPANPFRWIGLMSWTFNNGGGSTSGTTPIYVNKITGKFGVLFQHAGWCEYSFNQHWSGFSDNNTCGSQDSSATGTPIRDNFYQVFANKSVSDLALINGKALILRVRETTDEKQRCDDFAILGYGSEYACAKAHAPCPSTQDETLYVTRREDDAFRGGRFWTVQEIDFSTWNTSQTSHQLNGPQVRILDGSQALQFKIDTTDNRGVGSYHGGSLKQFKDGRIYLYLPVKHTLCLPETTNQLNSWDRSPKKTSGHSTMWLRLTQ